jgi:tRNA(His) 5'-end guanylyltransferase
MSKDKIGDRMKYNYENRTKQFLTRRVPTIIRLDGKAFHTYTKGLNKPFDDGLIADMQETTKFLCENVQGCKLGYTQSDEITLVLTDYDNLQTDAWFDYNVQKMTSVSASMATAKFNQLRVKREADMFYRTKETVLTFVKELIEEDTFIPLAFFDSRVFQIGEKEEVVNSLIWRQQDAERNSIQMLAQSLYSQKQLHGKNTSVLQDMCWDKGQNWNDLDSSKKRGSLIIKNTYVNDIICSVYPIHADSEGEYEFYPRKCRDDIAENTCRVCVPKLISEEMGYVQTWEQVKIKKLRTKWEVVDTPIFTKDRDVILNLI